MRRFPAAAVGAKHYPKMSWAKQEAIFFTGLLACLALLYRNYDMFDALPAMGELVAVYIAVRLALLLLIGLKSGIARFHLASACTTAV